MSSETALQRRYSLPAISLSGTETSAIEVDALVIGARAGGSTPLDEALAAVGFAARKDKIAVVPSGGAVAAMTVVAAGLSAEPTSEDLRRAAASAVRSARAAKASTVAIDLGIDSADQIAAVTEGVALGLYRFDAYTSIPADDADIPTVVESVQIITTAAGDDAVEQAHVDALVNAESVCLARDWVNTPPVDLRPPVFADQIVERVTSLPEAVSPALEVTVWDEQKLREERCGGILAVGAGSSVEPRLVEITYSPANATKHLALVGKGITFDSGGLSIKTGVGMQTMKMDMAGAATVVAATLAIARLGLPIQVSTWACLAENMPSGSATRPGDVVTMRSGKTVEVLNTDAEGRLVLGDGLAIAAEHQPDLIVDAATLTGACLVALGDRTAGVLGDDPSVASVLSAARTTGESMWQLPLVEEMKGNVTSSQIADIRQIGQKPYGGTIFAAAFLREFVAGLPWAHLDIAGPAYNEGGVRGHISAGGTGMGVRTLIQLARDLSA